ncbi:MAG: acyltransferase [Mucinivorans sp.]
MEHRENLAWVDWLRIIACFLVVMAHCVDPFVAQFDNNYSDFLTGAFWGSFVRPCVPLFVMVTGVLLLPVNMPLGQFYKKRLSRVLWPLAVWSILTPILFYFYVNYSGSTHPGFAMADFSIQGMLTKMFIWPLNFTYDTTPLWYLYMLVGLYLFMPIISPWLREASRGDLKKFLGIWIFSMCIPYLIMLAPVLGFTGNYGSMDLFGGCFWNPYGTFYYFSGFLGYIVLAFYLKRFPIDWSWAKTIKIAIPMFLVGYLVTAGGFILTQKYFPTSYQALEIVWYFSGINVFLMTLAAYLIISRIRVKSSALLSRVAGLTFGIYLAHFLFVHLAYDVLYSVLGSLPAALKIPLMGLMAFTITYALVWCLSKLPIRKYFIG